MNELKKKISLLLIISLILCSAGFNTLAHSLYEEATVSDIEEDELDIDDADKIAFKCCKNDQF